jgi:hypothetical protein
MAVSWRGLLLGLNLLVFFVFGWFVFHAAVLAALGGPSRITELDRAGVIDEAKLKEYNPVLADNLRHTLGIWVAENERHAAVRSALCGLAAALLNVVLLSIAIARAKPSQRRSPSQGNAGNRSIID